MRKTNILLFLGLFSILTACFMPVVPSRDPDVYNDYKVIQAWQKHDAVGRTDVEQRKKDFKECGVRKFFGGRLDLNTQYPEMTDKQADERRDKIEKCIKLKGYFYIGKERCTRNGKPTGKCN